MSETERDSGWSEQYAETGGWPPPTEGQRRYGPGTSPADPSAEPVPPADQPGGGYGPSAYTSSSDDGSPGAWDRPADQQAPTVGQRPGGENPWGRPIPTPGQQPDQTGGYAQPEWGQPADQAGPWGQPADQAGPWGQPADQWGQPADQAGPYGRPPESWAPGDSAYGRLGGQNPPAPRQRPRRPWDGRPAPARRPATPGGTPVVTITLIAICVVLYIAQQANPGFTARYALIPFAVEQGQYARLITSAFLHASLLHLSTNMITLYIVGAPLERVLRPVRYLIVYFLSALGGSLFSVWLSPEFSIGVGASGAIFGLFGALVVLRRQIGAEAGALAVLIGLNLVISFTVPNISWQAHIGGLVTGTLIALALQGIDRLSGSRPAS